MLLIVLYNGADPWNAARTLDDLIEPVPPVLSEYRPQQVYRVFLPKRLPGVKFESLADLHEVHDMLSNRVESWTEQWKREGLEQGRQETRYLLARQARHRFGPAVAAQAEPLLTAIANPLQLADLGDALLSCADGTAWLHVFHQERSASTTGNEHP